MHIFSLPSSSQSIFLILCNTVARAVLVDVDRFRQTDCTTSCCNTPVLSSVLRIMAISWPLPLSPRSYSNSERSKPAITLLRLVIATLVISSLFTTSLLITGVSAYILSIICDKNSDNCDFLKNCFFTP